MKHLNLNLDAGTKKYFYRQANRIARVIVEIDRRMRLLQKKCDKLRSNENWTFEPDNIIYNKYNKAWSRWTEYSKLKHELYKYKTMMTKCQINLVNGLTRKLFSKYCIENGKTTIKYFTRIKNKYYTILPSPFNQKSIKSRYFTDCLIVGANKSTIELNYIG